MIKEIFVDGFSDCFGTTFIFSRSIDSIRTVVVGPVLPETLTNS